MAGDTICMNACTMDLDTAPLVKSSQILYATPFSPRIFLNNSRDFNGCLHTARAPFSSGRCNRDAAHIFRNSFASLRRFISLWKIIWSCAIGCKGGNVVTLFSTVIFPREFLQNINSFASSEIRLREGGMDFDLKMLRFIETKYLAIVVF